MRDRITNKSLLALLLVIVQFASFARADTETHWAKADEFIRLSGSAAVLENMAQGQEAIISQETEMMFEALESQFFKREDIEIYLEAHNSEAKRIMRKVFDPERIREQLIPMYMAYFNEAELDELIAFHKSPIGVAMRERLPVILIHSNELGMEWAQEFLREMEPINLKLQKDLGIVH